MATQDEKKLMELARRVGRAKRMVTSADLAYNKAREAGRAALEVVNASVSELEAAQNALADFAGGCDGPRDGTNAVTNAVSPDNQG